MTSNAPEEAVGMGQLELVVKYGIGEFVDRSGEVLEDDYGIVVKALWTAASADKLIVVLFPISYSPHPFLYFLFTSPHQHIA